MLPVSGAEQLVASGAIGLRPMISRSGAYSRFVRPAPKRSFGRNRFQRPRLRASTFSSSITGGWKCGSPESATWLPVDLLVRIDVVVHELEQLLLQLLGPGARLEVQCNPLRRGPWSRHDNRRWTSSTRGRPREGRTSAVGAIYRWEAEYLREWVAFHRLVGVERFFLYDNALGGRRTSRRSRRSSRTARSSVHEWPMFPGQGPAYDHCLAQARRRGAVDRVHRRRRVPVLADRPPAARGAARYEDRPGVGVSRAWMGTAGHETQARGPGAGELRTRGLDLPEPNGPSNASSTRERVARRVNEHWFEFTDGEPPVDEHGRALEPLVPRRAHVRHAADQPLLHEVRGRGGAEVRTPERRQRPAARGAQPEGAEAAKRHLWTARRGDPTVPPRIGAFTRRAEIAA